MSDLPETTPETPEVPTLPAGAPEAPEVPTTPTHTVTPSPEALGRRAEDVATVEPSPPSPAELAYAVSEHHGIIEGLTERIHRLEEHLGL